jgi:hypothetical protein
MCYNKKSPSLEKGMDMQDSAKPVERTAMLVRLVSYENA